MSRPARPAPPLSASPSSSTVRLTIERVVAGGDGLARGADGRIVFVPGTLPGEQVEARIVSAKKDFARAEVDRVLVASPGRVTPRCPAVARGCGGCDWQHVDAATQLELKVEIVREALQRTGRVPSPQVVPGGAVSPWGYRTTMRFALERDGRPGLRRARSNDVVVLDACLVGCDSLSAMLPTLRCRGADEVTVRVGVASGDRRVTCSPATSTVSGLHAGTESNAAAVVVEHIAGVPLRVSSSSFFQSGPQAAELLVRTVREVGGEALADASVVLDAYGGIGLFSAMVVPDTARTVLVESSLSACEDARHNLAGRDVQIVCSTVEEWEPVPVDVVIADPARQGLGGVAVEVLVGTGAAAIVLVSCDPVSLARDAALLVAAGFRMAPTIVLDLFPQTHHVEAVTRFDRS